MAHSEVPVELCEQKRHYVHPEDGRQHIISPISWRIPLLDVKQTDIIHREPDQRVTHAGVEHEDEPVLQAQRSGGADGDDDRPGYENCSRGEQYLENEDEIIHRTVKVHREGNASAHRVCGVGEEHCSNSAARVRDFIELPGQITPIWCSTRSPDLISLFISMFRLQRIK